VGEHGRIETRHAWLITEPEVLAYLTPQGRWLGLSAIGMVYTERIANGTAAYERRYYILSGTPSAATFAHAVRGHWGIENRVHWVLDVTFREDHSRVRTGNAAQNFAVLRHIALNLLRQEPSRGSINTKRFRAALDEQYLLKVLQA
jgi:predicted transposase YbfD/YdcC